MVYALIDHRYDIIKYSNLKWNHKPQAIGFGRFVLYSNIYFLTKKQKQNNRHCVTCYVISMPYTLIRRI